MGVDLDGEAFDVLTWVNGKLPSHDSESLVLEVREEWEAAQGELSAALSMALTAVPQSVKEADRVMQMGTGLMDGVDRVSTRVEGVETGAEEAVAAIANADAVLRRVERARDMLARAAEVETLTERIEAIFVGGDLLAAADSIAKMRENLEALKDVPEISSKKEALYNADKKLNALAEPRLTNALESESVSGAQSALEIFEKSGREDAFISLYVSTRGAKLRKGWKDIIEAGEKRPTKTFYEALSVALDREASWLKEALPKLRQLLIPALIIDVFTLLDPPMNLELPKSLDVGGNLALETDEMLHKTGLLSAHLALWVTKACLSGDESGMQVDPEVLVQACECLTAPLRAYFEAFPVLERTFATHVMNEFPWNAIQNPTLEEASRHINEASAHLLKAGTQITTRCVERTKGALLGASFHAQNSVAINFASRAVKLIKTAPAFKVSDWISVQSSLSLLTNVASLARSWAEMKDSFATEAIISAMPFIEAAAGASSDEAMILTELIQLQSDSEVAIFWSLARDDALRKRSVAALQTDETAVSDKSGGDLRTLLQFCKDLVYECLFLNIQKALSTLPKVRDWGSDNKSEHEGGADVPEFSITPMAYATEVGEHLLKIPQQLEPYIPDDQDAILAFPSSTSADLEMNFARRWIGAIANGAMELYVERILRLPKLSSSGASQLAVDLDYVCSVLNALGVSVLGTVLGIRTVLEAEDIESAVHSIEDPNSKSKAARVAGIRGVSVTL